MKDKFLKDPKKVLVFNGAQVLIGIQRSVRATHELTGLNLQAISFACTGDLISSGGFYFRHVHPDIEIEQSDIGSLKLKDYDKMCGDKKRKYHSVREMAHKRRNTKNKLKKSE